MSYLVYYFLVNPVGLSRRKGGDSQKHPRTNIVEKERRRANLALALDYCVVVDRNIERQNYSNQKVATKQTDWEI
jgi:hypothetical protein